VDSIGQLQKNLLEGKVTSVEIVNACLQNIEKTKGHNAYIEVYAEEVLSQAAALDAKITEGGTLGPLFGVVFSIKDNLCYENHHSTAGSKILEGFKSPYSATVVSRILASDALIIGRTNCDEMCMGSTNETSIYGPVKNALDKESVSGGSSGGAAVAVALDTCHISIGSDTGGSIRQPAAFNGVYGYKPTYGTIPRWGLIAYGSSLDTIGLLGRNIADFQKVMSVLSGSDEQDSTAYKPAIQFNPTEKPRKNFKIAYSQDLCAHPDMDKAHQLHMAEYIAALKEKGHTLTSVDMPLTNFYVPTYYVLATAEASSNLSRYDGIRYGHRTSAAVEDYREMMTLSRSEGFGEEVKKRIMLGTYVLSEGYYDAYYKKAQKVRRMIKENLETILKSHDLFLLPTTTSDPWRIGQKPTDPLIHYLADIYTVLASLSGFPAISIPSKRSTHSKIPVSAQFISKKGTDNDLLEMSRILS